MRRRWTNDDDDNIDDDNDDDKDKDNNAKGGDRSNGTIVGRDNRGSKSIVNVARTPISALILARLLSLAMYLGPQCFIMKWLRRGLWQPNSIVLEPVPKDATGIREMGGRPNKIIPPPPCGGEQQGAARCRLLGELCNPPL